MAGRGDEIAAGAGGRGQSRASHADREQVIGTLKAAFVQGMLAKDEFDLRVGQTFAARTYGELAVLTADLPAVLAAAKPPQSAQARVRLLALGLAAWVAAYAWVYVEGMRDQGSTPYWWYLAIIGAGAVPPMLAVAGLRSRSVLMCDAVILAVDAVLALPSTGMLLLPAVVAAVAIAVLSSRT
jgi:hypothetical protein